MLPDLDLKMSTIDGRLYNLPRLEGSMEILYKFLRDKYEEINLEGSSWEKETKVIEAHDLVLELANLARREGLLALEERAEALDINDKSTELLSELLILVVDGTEPKILTEIGINRMITNNSPAYEGLINLLFFKGCLMIQAGENPYLIGSYLKSMMPDSCRKILEKREYEKKLSMDLERKEDLVSRLCEENKEVDDEDYGIVNQTALTFLAISDRSMERLLREIDNACITLAMKAMPGKARKRIFDNVSPRLGILLAEDMEFMGPVRMKDVEEACKDILRIFIRLADYSEIVGFDTTVLKMVLNIYDSAHKSNRELREQYQDIKKLIEKIYGRD